MQYAQGLSDLPLKNNQIDKNSVIQYCSSGKCLLSFAGNKALDDFIIMLPVSWIYLTEHVSSIKKINKPAHTYTRGLDYKTFYLFSLHLHSGFCFTLHLCISAHSILDFSSPVYLNIHPKSWLAFRASMSCSVTPTTCSILCSEDF